MPAKSPMTNALKLCRICSTWKMHEEFPRESRIKSGLASKCKSCNKEIAQRWRLDNPGKNAENVALWRLDNPDYMSEYYKSNREVLQKAGRNSNLTRLYGISPEEYWQKWEKQNGLCALCGKPEQGVNKKTGKPIVLAVDHCHKTGKVRDLLCRKCNTGLGNFEETEDLLWKALSYLQRHNSDKGD